MVIFVDAAFANNRDLSSQLGFVVALMDHADATNIIHYSSQKSKRITRSALVAELYAMMNGFDTATALNASFDQLGLNESAVTKQPSTNADNPSKGPTPTVIDSRSLYDSLVSLHSTTEKRLLIDLHLLRQEYERRGNRRGSLDTYRVNPCRRLNQGKADPRHEPVVTGHAEINAECVDRAHRAAFMGAKEALREGDN